jgi:hypothetical protein
VNFQREMLLFFQVGVSILKLKTFDFYEWYIMQNVQNLLCFVDKSTFFKVTKIFLSKKKKSGQKVLSGLVKFTSVDTKEPFTDIY